MNRFVQYLSFILWIVYFFLAVYREYRREDNTNIKDIIKKPFHFIRVDSILFLIIFLFYLKTVRADVLPYLYFVIVITNIVYLVYDIGDNYGFKKVKKNDYIYYYCGLLVVFLLIIYYLIMRDLINLSMVTLSVNIFIPFVVSFIKFNKKN